MTDKLVAGSWQITCEKSRWQLYLSVHFGINAHNDNSPWKRSPPLSQQYPSKNWDPVKPPLFENLVGDSNHQLPTTTQQKEGVDAHYVYIFKVNSTMETLEQFSIKHCVKYRIVVLICRSFYKACFNFD